MEPLRVHGSWASGYSKRVELALKLKGIPYEYVEEDLRKKSHELLQNNPIHKKVPVLVHNGKPVVESLNILEYIEDTWKETPLLPEDPYMRSRVRFWAHYYDQVFSKTMTSAVFGYGEEQEKGKIDAKECLRILEEGLQKDFSSQSSFLHGEQPGFLDIVMGTSSCSYESIEEAFGSEICERKQHPFFFKWLWTLRDHPLMKELLPPHDKFVAHLRYAREKNLKSSTV